MGFYRVGLNSKLKGLNNTESVLFWFKGFGRYKSRQSCGEKAAIVDKSKYGCWSTLEWQYMLAREHKPIEHCEVV